MTNLTAREAHVQILTGAQSRFVFEERTAIVELTTVPPRNESGERLLVIELKCKQKEKIGNAKIELTRESILELIDFAISELAIHPGELALAEFFEQITGRQE